ncbi:hypothetical protein BFW38_16670 [Terasakiispira papahanaumokuakeensis]|uniref:VTT domain-containing protein n=1 Tax=Terasakiispira papahanaumokuakeensis TaxID=197479 RepID=A0A1E2VDI7_9GAMM|nr:YqaA family protein [Terasakiispira papahanaumokuakeensis]ODC04922.1 hypothetical protein BFW38_16670 [Terasakiispira papahanaumokuakeensis]
MSVILSALGVASFLAATLLPGGSEVLLVTLQCQQSAPLWALWAVATCGNVAGSLVNWAIGRGVARIPATDSGRLGRYHRLAEALFERWGAVVLLLAWVPVIGDPLTAVAGWAKLPVGRFLFWVGIGKAARYGIIMAIAIEAGCGVGMGVQ